MTGEWIGLHVYYASNGDPMLVDCVRPLVRQLRERELIHRYFFVKYWLEGPHIRLRLLPRDGTGAEVRRLAEQELGTFLRRRPALYELNQEALHPVYKRLFLAEYGQQRWDTTYGPDGQMPLLPTNSVHLVRYEPEYDRYGGPDGIEVAEWQFEHSSDLVLTLLATTNVQVRPVLLGLSVQLSLLMCYALLEHDGAVADFLGRYRGYWESSYGAEPEPGNGQVNLERGYARSAARLRERIVAIRDGVRGSGGQPLPPLQRGWVDHAYELRDRLGALAKQGRLLLRRSGAGPDAVPVTDPATAFPIVLGSYLHMTNNRLGVTIRDEIYLSYVLERALAEPAGLAQGANQ